MKYLLYSWISIGLLNSIVWTKINFFEKRFSFVMKVTIFYLAILLGPIGVVLSDEFELVEKKDKKEEQKMPERDELLKLYSTIETLSKYNSMLVDALKFYANKKNYDVGLVKGSSEIDQDGGQRARYIIGL